MNSGDIAWMLISTALVVFMVPGLALFYGGHGQVKECIEHAKYEHVLHWYSPASVGNVFVDTW